MQPEHIRKYALACAALVLLGHPAGAEYRESRVSDAGTLQGRIHFEGDYPPAETLRPDRDADTCGLRIPVEQFVVDGDSKGLANAIVKIEGISAGKPFSSAEKSVEQIKCRYEPHVLVVRPGESFNIVNKDPVLHNVHAYRGDETVFNLAQPFQGQAW